jgi:hypothetical protein
LTVEERGDVVPAIRRERQDLQIRVGHGCILARPPVSACHHPPVDEPVDRLAWLRAMTSPPRRSIVELVADGVLDAEVGALAWVLVEARLPLIVAGLAQGAGKTTLLEALLDFLPSTVRRVDLAGVDEDFAWLPEAAALGWTGAVRRIGDPATGGPSPALPITPTSAYLVAAELSGHLPLYTWGRSARTLVRAASLGYGVGATIHADRLEDVHETLRSPAIGVSDDELSRLGLVVVIRPERGADGLIRRRVVAAHYERPIGRDEQGHIQRLPPAVLAARDDRTGRLEHFAWGVLPELGIRLGRAPGELEREQADRAALLEDLARDGVVDPASVRDAIAQHRRSQAGRRQVH